MRTVAGLSLSILILVQSSAVAQRQFGFDNTKSTGQPYMKPEETVGKMTVPPEFEVKLFVGEPDCINPIAFTIDEKGRVWVVESFEYPQRTPKGKAPRDRIVILEDTTGDGKADKRTVFAEGKDFPVPDARKKAGLGAFDMASGIEVGHGGVFLGAPPYLWFIENDNDKPGKFDVLLEGFGSQDTHETLNTFQWGPDGWLYGLHGVFTQSSVKSADSGQPPVRMNAAVWRYHPKRKKFELYAEGTSNPWGLDWRNTDGEFILACCVIPHLYHIVPGGIYRRQAGGSFNPYAFGEIKEICDHTFHKESGWAHAGLISLDVPHIPERFRNSVIFGSIHGSSVKQNVLKPNGSTFTASRGDDFLQSGDKNVRPINLRWGPNGDIYLSDWHDQHPCHQTPADAWTYEYGRIYRIQLKDRPYQKPTDLSQKSPQELYRLIGSDDPYTYRTALRMLGELDEKGREAVTELLSQDESEVPMSRVMAAAIAIGLSETSRLDRLEPFNDKEVNSTYISQAIRHMAHSGYTSEKFTAGLATLAKLTSKEPAIRELASAAIYMADETDVTPLIKALVQRKEFADDPLIPFLTWLAYEKVLGQKLNADAKAEPAVQDELAWLAEQAPDNRLVRDQMVPRVMRRLVATGRADDLALCLKFVSDVNDTVTRQKALEGITLELKGRTVQPPPSWPAVRDQLAKVEHAGIQEKLNSLAVSFRDPAAVKKAIETLRARDQKLDTRIAAVRELAELRPPEAVPLLERVTGELDANINLRIEAVRALAGYDVPEIAAKLLANWRQYPQPLKAEVVNLLSSRRSWAKSLLVAVERQIVAASDLGDNVIVRIQAFEDEPMNKLIEKVWGSTRPTPAELNALIDKTRADLNKSPGSIALGKKVFENHCAKCHKFEGSGQEVGPQLDGAARDIEYILANVIDPNRVIGAPYFLRIVNTIDGRVEQGLLASEDDKSITLKVENGILKRFDKDDLEGPVKVLEKSMMPEGLTAGMSPADFRDLVRYLMANPFLTTVTINGEQKTVGVSGLIAVPEKGAEIEASVKLNKPFATKLMVGAPAGFELFLNGEKVGTGTGAGEATTPDREQFGVTLRSGENRIKLVLRGEADGPLMLRFHDPYRFIQYPDSVEE